jgi:putative phosphoesterase
MKVALIGDIHANLPALEAVLAHAAQQGASAIWNVGDSVGYGPFPNEVVHRLRKEDALSTLGRFDHQVLRFKKRRRKWRKSKLPETFHSLSWTYDQLSKKNRKYLRFLSKEMRMRVAGNHILLTHTTPGWTKKCIVPDTPPNQLRRWLDEADVDVIVCGCSHQALVQQVDKAWVINPGSVGQPCDGDARASYAIAEFKSKELQVAHHRVEYDIEQLVAAIGKNDLPDAFAQMFLQGHALSQVLK